MGKPFLYYIHETTDPDSPVIFTGRNGHVAKEFGIPVNNLAKMMYRGQVNLHGKHFMERVSYNDISDEDRKKYMFNIFEKKEKPQKVRRKPKSKFDKNIEMIENMLDIYGNTIIYKDFEKVEARLTADGYHITAVHEPERRIKRLSIGKGNAGWEVWSECWILKLIRRDVIENV